MDERTPEYMVSEEDKREKMRTKMEKRAVRYEERLEKGSDSR